MAFTPNTKRKWPIVSGGMTWLGNGRVRFDIGFETFELPMTRRGFLRASKVMKAENAKLLARQ